MTILFCGIEGSTARGERLDPEIDGRVAARTFAAARKVVARHGGTLEKPVGDAVMAVFGLPTLHEDDALRAARAAVEIQAATHGLQGELDLGPDVAISLRIGITTGEVMTGDPAVGGSLVTGETVNEAARLERAAAQGQILISAQMYDLVRDAVVAEPLARTETDDAAEPAPTYRLLSVVPGAAGHRRRFDVPMVGRERELARLRQAFEDTVSEGSCHLFTILGTAGVGKSRLVAEFLATVTDQARILKGRCLPYGEGITYWPVREIVHAAAGIDEADDIAAARAKLAVLLAPHRDGTEIDRCVARAIGLSEEAVAPEELTWGIRRLLEVLAEDQPLVVVFDDIQWADSTFLDLIEHVAEWARESPLLLVCPARPELLEVRPGWGGGKLNATSVLLEPLPAGASRQLIEELGGGDLPATLQERIAAAAEGNALFIEEMINMLRADGVLGVDGRTIAKTSEIEQVRVPPTIRALLAARLDQLARGERAVAERASVVGRVFERSAVEEMSPETERPQLSADLLSLVRKELLRPDRSELAEDAYRFRHLLIRDAAYESLPKSERAVLHERFARWLIAEAGDRVSEYEEVIAFHLDQAHRWRVELGERGNLTSALASEAADWYIRAARKAAAILDFQGARPLWERAVALLDRASGAWLEAAYELAVVLGALEETADAAARYAEVMDGAADKDPALAAMARIGSFFLGRATNTAWNKAMVNVIRESMPVLEANGDPRHLAKAYSILSFALADSSVQSAYEAAQSSLHFAQAAGDPYGRRAATYWFLVIASAALEPAEARAVITTMIDATDLVGASRLGFLTAMTTVDAREGNLSAARDGLEEAIRIADRYRLPGEMVDTRIDAGRKARWANDLSSAESLYHRAVELATEHHVSYWLSYGQAWLALTLGDLGRADEAERVLADQAGHRGEDDIANTIAQIAQARVLGLRDNLTDGLALLKDAIQRMPPKAGLRTDAHVEEIRMLKEAGLENEAAAAAVAAASDMPEPPLPLHDLMIKEALVWQRPGRRA